MPIREAGTLSCTAAAAGGAVCGGGAEGAAGGGRTVAWARACSCRWRAACRAGTEWTCSITEVWYLACTGGAILCLSRLHHEEATIISYPIVKKMDGTATVSVGRCAMVPAE